MSFPSQITLDTKLGFPTTFFISQENRNLFNASWVRWFKITVFYNGKPYYYRIDMSITFHDDPELDHTLPVLTFSCYDLVEYILKENDVLCIF